MVHEEIQRKHTHETHQSILMRDIEKYKEYIEKYREILSNLRKELLMTEKDLVHLRAQRDQEPNNPIVQQRYRNAAAHLAEIQDQLFNHPESIEIQREIPQLESELQMINARFRRELM